MDAPLEAELLQQAPVRGVNLGSKSQDQDTMPPELDGRSIIDILLSVINVVEAK